MTLLINNKIISVYIKNILVITHGELYFNLSNIFSFLTKAQVKDKNDVHVKKEGHKDEATVYTKGKDNNIAKLSYRDVLVKGRNKEAEDFMNRRQQHERTVQVVKGSVNENKEAEDFMERCQQRDRAVQE